MSPEDLRSKIRSSAVKFTDEVIAIFGDAFASVAADFAGTSRPRAAAPRVAPTRGRIAARKVAAAPKARRASGKRARRSSTQLEKAGAAVIKLLGANRKGLRVEHINKALGTNTRELMRPIQKLLGEGKIRKSGERRATTYFVA